MPGLWGVLLGHLYGHELKGVAGERICKRMKINGLKTRFFVRLPRLS